MSNAAGTSVSAAVIASSFKSVPTDVSVVNLELQKLVSSNWPESEAYLKCGHPIQKIGLEVAVIVGSPSQDVFACVICKNRHPQTVCFADPESSGAPESFVSNHLITGRKFF